MVSKYGAKNIDSQYIQPIDEIEIKAFFGLYLSGVYKSTHKDVMSLFPINRTGRDIIMAVMSKQILFLLSTL